MVWRRPCARVFHTKLVIYVEPDVYEAARAVTESQEGSDGLEH